MSQKDSPKKFIPFRFLCEPIEVQYVKPPLLEKKPGCPDAFLWRGERYTIVEKLNEWFDYHRRGRMAKIWNPLIAKLQKAAVHGVGEWFIYRELRCE